MTRTAVPYIRTSTDDKGQNPERQKSLIQEWADQENVDLLEPVVDEGSSASKTNPFERDKFMDAVEQAVQAGADAIVVEQGDRFTRQGTKLASWAEVHLDLEYELSLYRADKALDDHGTLQGDLVDALKDELSREEMKKHAERVASGMEEAQNEGKHVGRPKKTCTQEELDLVHELRDDGLGWRKVAAEINKHRGVPDLATQDAKDKRRVSHSTVRRWAHNPTDYLEEEE